MACEPTGPEFKEGVGAVRHFPAMAGLITSVPPFGLVLLFSAFLVASDVLGVILIWSALRVGWRSLRAFWWPTMEGKIIHMEIERQGSDDEPMYQLKVGYSYTVDGLSYKGDCVEFLGVSTSNLRSQEELQQRLTAGPGVRVYYDPAQPGESCLVPGLSSTWWVFFLMAVFWESMSALLSYKFLPEFARG